MTFPVVDPQDSVHITLFCIQNKRQDAVGEVKIFIYLLFLFQFSSLTHLFLVSILSLLLLLSLL